MRWVSRALLSQTRSLPLARAALLHCQHNPPTSFVRGMLTWHRGVMAGESVVLRER